MNIELLHTVIENIYKAAAAVVPLLAIAAGLFTPMTREELRAHGYTEDEINNYMGE